MRINHNVPAITTQGALAANNRLLGKDLEKLSTGLRINRSSDDAAGLSVSEGLRTQVRGVEQAKKNVLDGISALNIAEGAMNEIHAILQRQRELAIQSSTATYSQTERDYMNQEYNQLVDEIQRIVSVTNFNKIALLDSNGAQFKESIFVGKDNKHSGFPDSEVGDALQVDANSGGSNLIWVKYEQIDAKSLQNTTGATTVGLTSFETAQATIKAIDEIVVAVSKMRADIGAYVNRLESTVNNLTVSSANQTAAESQLRDVDFAFQSSSFTKNQILTQSATAMLSQANSVPQNVLQLLR